MEEVDKIIIQSLLSIGCELPPEIQRISQLNQDMFIESVAKLLNTINSSGESLPTKLPPNTGVKYRICTKFATLCQQLGYKNEIGYQTFLYLNELDMRRLLMFLVEKLTKEIGSSTSKSDQDQTGSSGKGKNLNNLIAQQIKKSLSQFWIPDYCKLRGLNLDENNKYNKQGCKFLNDFNTTKLGIPINYLNSKSKYSKESQQYFEKHCLFITNQVTRQATDVLVSLIQLNEIERLKEQAFFKNDLNSAEETKKASEKQAKINELTSVIKDSIKKAEEIIDASKNSLILTNSDLADIESALQSGLKSNPAAKSSRFTHSERLQFTKEENEQNVSVLTASSEEKREEEIKKLKENLEDLNKSYDNLDDEIKKLNNLIQQIEEECKEQTELNKKLEESINIKQKTVNLINDAPMNIQKLKEDIGNHEKKMQTLQEQWDNHKKPLEQEYDDLKQSIQNKKLQMQQKIEETKKLRAEIDELNEDLTAKEDFVKDLNKDYENLQKESSKTTNRQFYNKRILEIVANIDKQKKEIDKILIETKMIQKEINQLTGKLERIFNATDEIIFKDAKKDEANKKVYKLFININENYEELIRTIEESSHIERDLRDLEDQVNSESQNKTEENLEKLSVDLKQIKDENEQLVAKLKSIKN